MLLLGFHGTTKKNLYPKLSNKKWAPPCGWCPFFCFGKICKRRCLGSLLLDNHSAHRSKETMNYLATQPNRFKFTFTPKHASWLNLIESFFGKMARTCLRGLRVRSKEELVNHINRWIMQVNAEPVVYRWKWKLEDIESAFT